MCWIFIVLVGFHPKIKKISIVPGEVLNNLSQWTEGNTLP